MKSPKPMPSIVDVMADPTLFARWFRRKWLRVDSWKAWRAFLAALFGLALDPEAAQIYARHTNRTDTPAGPFAEAWLAVGRRGGKSLIAALIVTYLAVFRDYSTILAPGETGLAMCIASDRRQAQVVLGYVRAFFRNIPMLRAMVIGETKESIQLNNSVNVEVHTASYRAVRGYTVVGAVLDEVAFFRTDESATPDVELVNALRPAMSTVPGALLLAISSPYARRGSLWETYREHFGKAGSPVLVWQADSRSMNPTISEKLIATAYARDPASAAAEYGAQFRADLEAFITRELIDRVVVAGRTELPFVDGLRYYAFADPSGGSSDSFTLAISHAQDGRAVLDLVREVKPPFSPEATTREFAAVLKSYKVTLVSGDCYAGLWPREQFLKFGIQYEPSELDRSALYLELLPAVASGQCELLHSQRLIGQFCGLERRTARSGKDSVDHAPGNHDDLANAAAGALVRALAACKAWPFLDWPKAFPDARVQTDVDGTASKPATAEEVFTRSAAAQMEAAIVGDSRVGFVFGAQRHKLVTREVVSQAGVAAPSSCPECGAFLASREDRFGNRLLSCGSCNWSTKIAPRASKRYDGRVQNS
jgi:hypothetical protein